MVYDIETIDALVNELGGPAQLAHRYGIGGSAVCNWIARGFIPPSWHMRLYCELREMDKTADPEIFEMPAEKFSVLFPTHGKRRPGNGVSAAA